MHAMVLSQSALAAADLQGYEELTKAAEESKKRAEAIDRLNAAKVVPAHVLHEFRRFGHCKINAERSDMCR
jgi:hypothetical protein